MAKLNTPITELCEYERGEPVAGRRPTSLHTGPTANAQSASSTPSSSRA